jgi:hypothetical protein
MKMRLAIRRFSFWISLLGASISAAAAIALAADLATSQWIYLGADGKLVYKTTPAGDKIMDFSYAGYMGGGVALPSVPVKRTVEAPAAEKADDDATAVIQTAIDEVAALPLVDGFRGAVLLKPGTFSCASTINIRESGIVLRGSGSGADDPHRTTIKLIGRPHLAIALRSAGGRNRNPPETDAAKTSIADAYVPSGAKSFNVSDASQLAVGDTISIRRPVTATWIKFMGMDDMVRDGKAQTWLRAGTTTNTERKIAAIAGSTITVDVPLSDSFDSQYLNPPGTAVVKIKPPATISQSGIEDLHIESPPQAFNHSQPHFQALRISGRDCWARDVVIDETMNSVGVNGSRITLLRVAVNRKAEHQGASKPAEFAPNGSQVLLDRCSVTADNVWFSATGGEQAGPVVLLNCRFSGKSRAESHQRWSTGMLYDNCTAPEGGIEIRNRGSMGSGHGWSMGWGVVWNCQAKDFLIQNPPGAANWLIGSIGEFTSAPRPFGKGPDLPEGVIDSQSVPVTPHSLYLAQLAERLGPEAVKNIGY